MLGTALSGEDRYYGPFGPQPEATVAYGDWPAPDDYRLSAAPGSARADFEGQTQPLWPAPSGAPDREAFASAAVPPRPGRRGPRTAAVIATAAVVALVIGGGAGYAGARLAQRAEPAAAASATPSKASTPASTPGAPQGSPSPAPPSLDTVAVARKVLPGTVMIQVGSSTGSGFVMDQQGRIMTNNHVVAGAADGDRIRVQFSDGRRQTATLVGRSPSYDLAVIKVKAAASLQPIEIGDSDASEVGQPVIAVGSPLGLPGTVTQGIVSAQRRPVVVTGASDADAPTAYIDAIQTDAPINPGNSGGPLIDAGARVIGINSAILTLGSGRGQAGSIGLGFAIPINQAVTISRQLISDGRATYPVIGASVATASGGVELTSVDSGGPARKAGLREGDLITKVDGRTVAGMEELIVDIRTRRPGDVVVLDYRRGSARDQARVTLGSKEG